MQHRVVGTVGRQYGGLERPYLHPLQVEFAQAGARIGVRKNNTSTLGSDVINVLCRFGSRGRQH